jgi:Ca2+-binding EF-hand superfamily protein
VRDYLETRENELLFYKERDNVTMTNKEQDVYKAQLRDHTKERGILKERLKKLAEEYNALSNDYHNLRSENELLRQMSKVPENFGEELKDYKVQQEKNMVFYKRKGELIEEENKNLQMALTQANYKIKQQALLYCDTTRYKDLTMEQLEHLDNVALSMKDGSYVIPLTDDTLKYKQLWENEKAKNEVYEKMVGEGGDTIFNRGPSSATLNNNGISEKQYLTLLDAIKAQKERNVGEPPNTNVEQTDGGLRITQANRPPKPIPGPFGDYTDTTEGLSYKFGNGKLAIKSYEDELSGFDLDKAKYLISALQLQNLESIELLSRKDAEAMIINGELESMRKALRKTMNIEDELFIRHHVEIKKKDNETESLKRENFNFKTLNMELSSKLELYENNLDLIRKSNPAKLEAKLSEMTKKSAIVETNIIRLSRKYDALETEYMEQGKTWKKMEVDQSQREYDLIERLNGLLEWKSDATEKLRIMLERAKNSCAKELVEVAQNKVNLLQNKLANSQMRETELEKQLSMLRGAEREKEDLKRKVKEMEDEIAGTETEMEILSMRLASVDPVYKRYTLIFKKIASILRNNKITSLQLFQAYDVDKNNTLSKVEFTNALKSMGVILSTDEAETFFMFMDLDGQGSIDYKEFARKLKRMGIVMRSREEELVFKLWETITQGGLTLEQAFEVIDKDKDNLISYKDMVEAFDQIGLGVNPKDIAELFKAADITGDGKISSAEFIYLFKKYNKLQNDTNPSDTTLDWKFEIMSRLDKVAEMKKTSLDTIYAGFDADNDGKVTLDEFTRIFKQMEVKIPRKELEKLFYSIDLNRSGFISFPEFQGFINVTSVLN